MGINLEMRDIFPWALAALFAGVAVGWRLVARREPPGHGPLMVSRLNALAAIVWLALGITRAA